MGGGGRGVDLPFFVNLSKIYKKKGKPEDG